MSTTPQQTQATSADEKQPVVLPEIPPVAVTKNEVPLNFQVAVEDRGPNAGKSFYMTPDRELSLADLIKIAGDEFARKQLWIRVKKAFKSIYEKTLESSTDKNTFDAVTFAGLVSNYTFHSESTKVLQQKILDILSQMDGISMDTPEGATKFKELLAQMRGYRDAIEDKKREAAAPVVAEEED